MLTAALKAKLDALCRDAVLARDGYACIRCGAKTSLSWCHIFSRKYLSTRWEPDNGFTGCPSCHAWWHLHPNDAINWIEQTLPPHRLARLRHLLSSAHKPDPLELQARLLALRPNPFTKPLP